MASCRDCTIPSHNVTYCSNKTSPFWVESPLNVLNFGILPTIWEVTLWQEILHYGSGIGLGNCVFVPSTNTLSHTCNVLYNLSISWPSPKTNKVFLLSSLCTTIGSMVVYSYINPAMMSGFVNAEDNACPISNSITKTTVLLLLSPNGMGICFQLMMLTSWQLQNSNYRDN